MQIAHQTFPDIAVILMVRYEVFVLGKQETGDDARSGYTSSLWETLSEIEKKHTLVLIQKKNRDRIIVVSRVGKKFSASHDLRTPAS
jgi:hypothetical protein